MGHYVGIDLHRRRSVIVVLDEDGEELWTRKIDNEPATLAAAITDAGPDPEVVIEATWGWYWAADVITDAGGTVHLAHPLGIAAFENRRVKTDKIDARLLADLLRMGMLPEAWIAPAPIREQRELVRYRRKLSQLCAGLKTQVHAVIGKEGLIPPMNHLWGPGGKDWLDDITMAEAFEVRLRSLRRLIKTYDNDSLPRVLLHADKRYVELTERDDGETWRFHRGRLPLGAIYQLADRTTALRLGLSTPSTRNAFLGLTANTYAPYLLDGSQQRKDMQLLGRIASTVPIRLVERLDDLGSVSRLCETILTDLPRLQHSRGVTDTPR